jgi:2-methylisocitrate lyase-like PEP mutase family enzyme
VGSRLGAFARRPGFRGVGNHQLGVRKLHWARGRGEGAADTIRLAAEAGVVGGSIEDFSGDPDKPIYDFDLAVERVQAAVEAARSLDFHFTLTARAENLLRGRKDLDDTIRRLQAFEAAGADVLYAPAP